MRKLLVSLALLCGLHGAAHACDPAAFGALPNDGLDDAPGLTAALAAGDVCLRAGDYHLWKHGQVSVTVPSNRTFSGQGPSSRLVMTASGGNGAWSGVRLLGSNIVVRELSITVEAWDTEEQTHAFSVAGPSSGVLFTAVHVSNPVRYRPDGTMWPSGDCIRLGGGNTDAQVVRRVVITASIFQNCDRSGLQVQREVEDVVVAGCAFHDTGDQDIDVEATGTSRVDGLVITGNTFSGGQQGNFAIAVQCTAGICSNVTISNNVFRSRGIYAFNAEYLAISGNIVRNQALGIDPTIWIHKYARDVVVANNVVTRDGVSGPLFAVKDHNSGYPRNVSIRGNTARQNTGGPIFQYRGAQAIVVADNSFRRDTLGALAIAETSSQLISRDVVVTNNRLTGQFPSWLNEGPATLLSSTLSGTNVLVLDP